jgi:hypothetical protein
MDIPRPGAGIPTNKVDSCPYHEKRQRNGTDDLYSHATSSVPIDFIMSYIITSPCLEWFVLFTML